MRNSVKRKRTTIDLTTQTLLDFDLGESSSDSDFRIEDHDDESDDFSICSDKEDKGGDNDDDDDDDDGDDDDDDDDEDEDDEDEDEDEDERDSKQVNGTNEKPPNETDEKKVTVPSVTVVSEKDAAIQKLLMKSICCACLGDRSDDQNEIVECDGCGVTVHEGCYGVSECASVTSTISSCSTEPWFCDACKAGVENPDCELCPNRGGIFKETDVGRWVHLVCALYVPGVAFGEVDQLSSVTLFEMPYNKWGAKTCCLCEDAKLARTGVCIGCDAGMCKTYFHVTCAQYHGLLSEAHSEEADQADPFYAHCKIHSDKTLIKHRKRNYNAIRMRAVHRATEDAARRQQKPTPEQVRIERKLQKHRRRYQHGKETKNPPWVPTQKMPRLLITSATACKKMLLKGELMGLDMAAIEFQEAQMASLADVRKKWHIPPAFSVEFIGYYLDRAIRLVDMKRNLQEQIALNRQLLGKQQQLRNTYERSVARNQEAVQANEAHKASIARLYEHLCALCPNKPLIPIDQIGRPAQAPQAAAARPPQPSPPTQPPTLVLPSTSATSTAPPMRLNQPSVVINATQFSGATPPTARTMSVPTAAALKMGVGFPLQNLMVPGKHRDDTTGRILSTQCKQHNSGSEELLNECGICKRCNDQHLLAKCDTCRLHYHLGCLNPPLTRHPKKSKLYGWQCSECDKSDDSNPESIIIPKAPRKSRKRYTKDGTIVACDYAFGEQQQPQQAMDKKSITPKSPGKRGRKRKSLDSVPSVPRLAEPTVEDEPPEPADDPEGEQSPLLDSTLSVLLDTSDEQAGKEVESTTPALPASDAAANSNHQPVADDGATSSTHHKHSKRRKEKHRNRSPGDPDRFGSKDHKRKRKRKNHDYGSPVVDQTDPDYSRPRIKIKIKSVPDGSNTHTTQIFYVRDETPPAETVPTSPERLVSGAADSSSQMVICKDNLMVEVEPMSSTEHQFNGGGHHHATLTTGGRARTKRESIGSRMNVCSTTASGGGTLNGNDDCICDVCQGTGTANNIVQCDECHKNYHFGCLEPPLKKTPKRRGYSWHCADCDPTDVEN